MIRLPADFIQQMSQQLSPQEQPAFFAAYNAPYIRALRLNPLKPAINTDMIDGLLDPVAWEATGRYLTVESTAGAHPLHECGAYYIQDASAMLPAAVLSPRPGEKVLDLCAAPGGKSTQLAAGLQGTGLLVANEPVPKRAQILSRNIERMGITNALVISAYPDQLAACWPNGFDAVMVDAPCSGEGMFRRHPETCGEWSLSQRDGCAARQSDILDQAALMVRPGGRLVYATCTLNTVENEENIRAFCRRHPDFSPVSFSLPGVNAPDGMFTCYPHLVRGEGQFVALLHRQGEGEAILAPDHTLPRPGKQEVQLLRSFWADAPQPTGLLGDTMVCLPDCPDLSRLKVHRVGLHLGSVKGKLFQPDHAWAVCTQAPAMPHVELSEEQALRYQHGETISIDPSIHGWILPTLQGLPLGWGKVSDGMMKNHYPKGLRR